MHFFFFFFLMRLEVDNCFPTCISWCFTGDIVHLLRNIIQTKLSYLDSSYLSKILECLYTLILLCPCPTKLYSDTQSSPM